MISIKKCIEEVVYNNLFLEDALYNDYLNLSSFALYILPRVEQMSKKNVTIWSIKIALSRIAKEKQKTIKFYNIKNDNIFVKKNISAVTLNNTNYNTLLIREIQSLDLWSNKDYFWIIRWVSETDIIYSQNLKSWIENIINSWDIKLKISNLWAIWIHLDEKFLNTPWLLYSLSKKLTFHNINIINVISTYTEIVFIVDQKDIKKAFEVLVI